MPLENHEKYAILSGIDDPDKYVQMKCAWMRISFRARDFHSAIKFNNRNLKRKVPNEYIENVGQDIAQRVQDFEREFLIPFHEKFNKMLKVKRK